MSRKPQRARSRRTGASAVESAALESAEVGPFTITLLDVGVEQYGDAILCRFGPVSVLIDGAHPGNHRPTDGHPAIQDQLRPLLPQRDGASVVTLLVVSHAHQDHIGCLPQLVREGHLAAEWAIVADPDLGWGRTGKELAAPEVSPAALQIAEALREEPLVGSEPAEEKALLEKGRSLDVEYRGMLEALAAKGTRVIPFQGSNHPSLLPLVRNLARRGVAMKVLGPSQRQVAACAEGISGGLKALSVEAEKALQAEAAGGAGLETGAPKSPEDAQRDIYRRYASFFASETEKAGGLEAPGIPRVSNYVNLQSTVLMFEHRGRKILLTGDMQLSDPQTRDPVVLQGMKFLLSAIRRNAPYDFLKMSHHGSDNGISADLLEVMGNPPLLGICAGTNSRHHPDEGTLDLLKSTLAGREVRWARTDRNGQTTITFDGGDPTVTVSQGQLNDASPPGTRP